MALIRYPGSKEKLLAPITKRFPEEMLVQLISSNKRWEYREPFFGAGAIGFNILRGIVGSCAVWLNDIDPAMVALWTSVRYHHAELIEKVLAFRPSDEEAAAAFYRLKEEDGRRDLPTPEMGFRKLVLHRTSFSGLGYKAGGPIGGKDQTNSKYGASCRWAPENMASEIENLHMCLAKFEQFQFTNLDFADCIRGAPRECFIYADPPYVEKGPELYKHPLDDNDHVRLRDALRDCEASWVLSYDDHEVVRELYGDWCEIENVSITYTMTNAAAAGQKKRPKNSEVVIFRPSRRQAGTA